MGFRVLTPRADRSSLKSQRSSGPVRRVLTLGGSGFLAGLGVGELSAGGGLWDRNRGGLHNFYRMLLGLKGT